MPDRRWVAGLQGGCFVGPYQCSSRPAPLLIAVLMVSGVPPCLPVVGAVLCEWLGIFVFLFTIGCNRYLIGIS